MTSLQRLAEVLTETIARTGAYAPAILLFATFVEYVFPPFPGDLVVVLGAWYAAQGQLSWAAAFASVTAGAVLGAWVDYRIGVAVGLRIDRRMARRSPLTEARLARFEASYRRFGAWLLVLNRFLPGVRAFLFIAAGASGLPLGKVLLCGAVSAALWNALLLGAGALVAQNAEELVALVDRYTHFAWWLLAAAALAVLAVAFVRRRSAGRARAAGEGR